MLESIRNNRQMDSSFYGVEKILHYSREQRKFFPFSCPKEKTSPFKTDGVPIRARRKSILHSKQIACYSIMMHYYELARSERGVYINWYMYTLYCTLPMLRRKRKRVQASSAKDICDNC
mmetsp:Transcript_14648/g.35744  ORF Transcript_14648/g.35744 Transcript_14648/m.35744 type:complete len:119 (-) Transcript_14648:233-589(-)